MFRVMGGSIWTDDKWAADNARTMFGMSGRTTHHEAEAELTVSAATGVDSMLSSEEADRLLDKHMDRWSTLLDRLK